MAHLVKGSLALVTGSSSGIGRESCKVLAREGATVVVTCINEAGAKETLKQMTGSGHSVMKYDVTNFIAAPEIVKTIIQKYKKPPNILVNSAGVLRIVPAFQETPEEFQKVLDINLKGTVFTSLAVCKELVAAKIPGSVVNISSVVARTGLAGITAYKVTKIGCDAVTACMAKDMSSYNIRINSVRPGLIQTPMTDNLKPETQLTEDTWTPRICTKRLGKPEVTVAGFRGGDQPPWTSSCGILKDILKYLQQSDFAQRRRYRFLV
ncbi:hypothetical protein J6590_051444 [Homalodisca vitripennis]|nr:hypothetical protein J6590_051444 [Homalodisca vitripennis]